MKMTKRINAENSDMDVSVEIRFDTGSHLTKSESQERADRVFDDLVSALMNRFHASKIEYKTKEAIK